MSTRIDINVAADLLRRLNRSQSQANRQSLQERERRDRLTQQGTTLRQQQNAAAGLNFDGSIYRSRPTRPRFLEEPAATPLLTTPGFVLVPQSGYVGTGIPAQVRRLSPLSFVSQNAAPGLTVDLTGGPNQTGSLSGLNLNRALSSLTYGELLNTPHTLEAIINMNTLEDIQYPGDSDMGFGYSVYNPNSSSVFDYYGISLIWFMYPLFSGTEITANRGSEVLLSGNTDDMHIVSSESINYANRIINPAVHDPGQWRHIAYQYSPPNEAGEITESVYFKGIRIYSVTGPNLYSPPPEDLQNPVRFYVGAYRPTFPSPRLPRIHGFRFTKKALYGSEPFAPPTTITGLAR